MSRTLRLPQFRKILYEEQPYEDNYVGADFLAELVKNAHVQQFDYWKCVLESCAFCQQFSLVAIFGVLFIYMLNNVLPIDFLIVFDAGLLLVGFAIYFANVRSSERILTTFVTQSASVCKIGLVLLLLAPVLQSLTVEYSNDTIYALVFILTSVHLFTHDYGFVNGYTTRFEGTLSLNSIIFVSVLLASRLHSTLHTFALIAFAIELFAMLPILRSYLKKWSPDFHILLTWELFCIAFSMLFPLSTSLAILLCFVCLFLTFLAPLSLIYVQQYKDKIQGPWDEAPNVVPPT